MLTRRDWMAGAGGMGAGWLLAHSVPGFAAGATQQNPAASDGAAAKTSAAPAFSQLGARSIDGAGSLKAHAAAQGLLAGSAVDVDILERNPEYRLLLAEQCNIVVAENAMKWAPLRPAPETFHFNDADALMAFAEQHGIAVRGHNLCWHEQLPKWFDSIVTPANAAKYLTEHIRTVAGRYRGRIRAWDVVNEAILLKDGKPDGLRDSPWLRLLGPDYISLAFRTAREADPQAMLTYNDYDLEYDTPEQAAKRAAVLSLLRGMKASGTPIDAVGVQSHLTADSPNKLGAGISQFVQDVQAMGLKVFVTEMDVNDDNVASDDPALRDAAVGKVYGDYLTTMLAHPAVTDVLTWGISDNHSWLNNSKTHEEKHPSRQERALPLDAAYQPKPAFFALRATLDRSKG
jgi:endo-1,4-beta-xylanase